MEVQHLIYEIRSLYRSRLRMLTNAISLNLQPITSLHFYDIKRQRRKFTLTFFITVYSVFLLIACSSQPPRGEISQAKLAIDNANNSKAPQYAALELSIARDEFDKAGEALHNKKYPEARRLAAQALVDAQLAQAKADAENSRIAAVELRKSIEILKKEAQPTSLGR